MTVSVILPTYNEANNIAPLIYQITNCLTEIDHEIIVVDDHSPDGTAQIVEQNMLRFKHLKLIVRKENRGLVPSIWEGIMAAKSEICIWMDADLSMNPNLLMMFIDQIHDGADLVLGSRYIQGGGIKGVAESHPKKSILAAAMHILRSNDSILSALLSFWGNKVTKWYLNIPIHDYSSGYFGGRRQTLLELGLEGNTIDYCMSLPFRAVMQGFNVVEIPMILATRQQGESKTSGSIIQIMRLSIQCVRKAVYLKKNIADMRS